MSAILRLLALLCLCTLGAPSVAAPNGGYAARDDVARFIEEMHERNGFDPDDLRRLFGEAQMIPAVIKYVLPPSSPTQRSWRVYRSRYLDGIRITGGLEFWRRNEAVLNAANEQFGVPPEIIVAIVGVETIYGRNIGGFQTFSALTTLAFDYPPRADLFRHELEELLLLARDQRRDVRDFKGSYAGALGLSQFLPSSWRKYAIDFDDDGTIDLYGSEADVIGSVANFLAVHGWERAGPVAQPVAAIEGDVKAMLDSDIEPLLNTDDLELLGVSPQHEVEAGRKFALIDLVAPNDATEYWLGYQNFYVITRYNRSSFYAMAVYQLAESLRTAWLARSQLEQ